MKKITIIGAGLSGLSASCYLAREGNDVTLIDKNEGPGGRLSYFEKEDFFKKFYHPTSLYMQNPAIMIWPTANLQSAISR